MFLNLVIYFGIMYFCIKKLNEQTNNKEDNNTDTDNENDFKR